MTQKSDGGNGNCSTGVELLKCRVQELNAKRSARVSLTCHKVIMMFVLNLVKLLIGLIQMNAGWITLYLVQQKVKMGNDSTQGVAIE